MSQPFAVPQLLSQPHAKAYYRVSSGDQSIEAQRHALGGGFDREFSDVGVSGGVPAATRPGFAKLLEQVRRDDVVCVYAVDRLGRDALIIPDTEKSALFYIQYLVDNSHVFENAFKLALYRRAAEGLVDLLLVQTRGGGPSLQNILKMAFAVKGRHGETTRIVPGSLGDLNPWLRHRSVAAALDIICHPKPEVPPEGHIFLRNWLSHRHRGGRAAAAFEASGWDLLVFLAFELDPAVAGEARLQFFGLESRWASAREAAGIA